jgi:hypothetical protein
MTQEKKLKCEGYCEGQCFGDVKEVLVSGNGINAPFQFNYCQNAREEDIWRGFNVEILGRNAEKSCTIPCSPSDWKPGGKCDKKGCYHE